MSTNRRKPSRAERRRSQRRMRACAAALTLLCIVAVGTMAFVNRLPIGKDYTYTQESDLWFVRDGEMAIAAPEVVLFTAPPTPTPTPAPTATHAPAASPTPTATPEANASVA